MDLREDGPIVHGEPQHVVAEDHIKLRGSEGEPGGIHQPEAMRRSEPRVVRPAAQVDRSVAGRADDALPRYDPRGRARGPDLEHLAPVPEPGADEAAEKDQNRPVTRLRPTPGTQAAPRPRPVARERGEPPAAGPTHDAPRGPGPAGIVPALRPAVAPPRRWPAIPAYPAFPGLPDATGKSHSARGAPLLH